MSKEIINTILLAILFLSLFAIAEILYHRLNLKAESTRKIVHVGTGLITMLFPLLLQSQWSVLLLCACFGLILLLSLRMHLLPSINAIKRTSVGSLLYPVAVYICFIAYQHFHNLLFFYLPVLNMAICDPVAALVGNRWPVGKCKINNSSKTFIGSLAFFITSFILTIALFYFFSAEISEQKEVLMISFLIAFFSATTEAVSTKGIDNITIPVCVLIILTLANV